MTDQLLRDLLQERVADVTTRDLSVAAWRTGRRSRRRERLAVVGAAVVLTAVAASGAAVLGDGRSTGPAPAPGVPSQSPSPVRQGEADATYQGVPVWWSPSRQEEGDLPRLDSDVLPPAIDLESGPMVKAIDHAVAAFAMGDRIHLVDERGGQVAVDIGRLADVTKPNGYAYRPVHNSMLSPGGTRLVFPQDGSIAVYSIEDGWSDIDTGDLVTRFVRWVDEDTISLPPGPGRLGDVYDVRSGGPVEPGATVQAQSSVLEPPFDPWPAQAFGPTKRSADASAAQAWGMGVPIPVDDAGTSSSDPEFIAAHVRGQTSVLSVTWSIHEDSDSGRFLQCCPVAGWLDEQTLVYESKQTEPALVAWTVGSDRFALVSTIQGEYSLASFADLS